MKIFIGLEIHIELKTKSKMFCSCSADHFNKKPNTQVCPVCLGLPGALPAANQKAIKQTTLTGFALDCQPLFFSKFDRKNYFYSDLPKGYQISQYDLPFCQKGRVGDIRIRRVHLEEDTAKMIHRNKQTLIDFNRSGVPLMEIVTEPDIHSPEQAKKFLKQLQQTIRHLGVSGADMEKGSMRLEANISVSHDEKLPPYKVEIKNLNSFRFLEKAITYEIKRQTELLGKNQKPIQETRGWHEAKQITYSQRSKEEAQDYRYFPEPDLPPIRWTKKDISKLQQQLPELPEDKTNQFAKDFKITSEQARILLASQSRADYFEKAAEIAKKQQISIQKIANMIINKRVNIDKTSPNELIQLISQKQTQPNMDQNQLEEIIEQVIKESKTLVEQYKEGKTGVLEFLVGQVMALTRGQASPQQTRQLIKKKLN